MSEGKPKEPSGLVRLASKMGMDYVVHSSFLYPHSDSVWMDAFWHCGNNSFGPWILGSTESRFVIRQIFSGIANFHRFGTNAGISFLDSFVSSISREIFPRMSCFSSPSTHQRCFRRMMLTLKRNGGIYEDIYNYIQNLGQPFTKYSQLLNEKPLYSAPQLGLSPIPISESQRKSIESLMRRELNRSIRMVFDPNSLIFIGRDGPIEIYEALLASGEKVTISLMPSIVSRMRSLDLIPFRIAGAILKVLPFARPESQLFDSILARTDFSLRKEAESRLSILSKMGVHEDLSNHSLFESAKKCDFSLFIPAPIKSLCSEHLMVTDRAPQQRISQSTFHVMGAAYGAAMKMMNNGDFFVPDLSIRNIRVSGDTVSLSRWSSYSTFGQGEIRSMIALFWAMRTKSPSCIGKYAKSLRISGLSSGRFEATYGGIRPVLENQANAFLASAEISAVLMEHTAGAGARAMRFLEGSFRSIFDSYPL